MNKRLICLLLSLVMMIACFVGCGKKDDGKAIKDIEDEASEAAMTLSMYLLCEEEMSEDQKTAIETAVNKITKSKFKTMLKLYYYTADDYYAALEESFRKRQEAVDAGLIGAGSSAGNEEESATEEETYTDEWGVTQIKYPEIDSFQVDIFYMSGYAKFAEYMEMGMLSRLDEELSSASKLLNDYITPSYLSYMKSLNDGTYAIPNNAAIGEYTYLLLNKDVLAKTRYNTNNGLANFTSLTCDAVQDVLGQVADEYKDYVPLYSCLGENGLAVSGVKYWGTDADGVLSNDFSVLGSEYLVGSKYKTQESYMASVGSILNVSSFNDQLKTLKKYKTLGYFGTEQDLKDGKAAVAYMQGSPDVAAAYSDKYEAVVIGKPTLTTEDVYRNMFAVSTYTISLSRSMEIVTYLNTNEDFRNLILYGIEDENYELVNSDYLDAEGTPYKVVRRLNNNYMMDVNKTGNALIAYTLDGGDPTLNDLLKKQNNDAVISITMGFRLDITDYSIDMTQFDELRTLSASVLKKIEDISIDLKPSDYATEAEFDAAFDKAFKEAIAPINSEISAASCISSLRSYSEPASEDANCGLGFAYHYWAENVVKIYVEEEE
ncbi:MAG: hypothetical protein J6B72_02590 [Clostridia bacterium]|nr:hypothetical protein [Clostridia bacterium]